MKTPVKAVIAKGKKSFYGDKVLTLQLDGKNWEDTEGFIKKHNLGLGAVVYLQLKDKESKSNLQLRAVHGFLRIYDIFLQEFVDGYIDIHDLKNTIKYKYGIIEYWEHNGKTFATLKSFADYTMSELSPVVDGLMQEMDKNFMEYNYSGKNFDKYQQIKKEMQERSNQKEPIEPSEEIELF